MFPQGAKKKKPFGTVCACALVSSLMTFCQYKILIIA